MRFTALLLAAVSLTGSFALSVPRDDNTIETRNEGVSVSGGDHADLTRRGGQGGCGKHAYESYGGCICYKSGYTWNYRTKSCSPRDPCGKWAHLKGKHCVCNQSGYNWNSKDKSCTPPNPCGRWAHLEGHHCVCNQYGYTWNPSTKACTPPNPCGKSAHLEDKQCVCNQSGYIFNSNTKTCVQCNTDTDCSGGKVCSSQNTCVPCSSTNPCASGYQCSFGSCQKTPVCTDGLTYGLYGLSESDDDSSHPGQFPYNYDTTWFSNLDFPTIFTGVSGPTGQSGVTDTIGIPTVCDADFTVYGQEFSIAPQWCIVQHVGFFHPAKTGTYTFSESSVDDGLLVWLGDDAVSGYTTSNALLAKNYFDMPQAGSVTYPVTEAGEYIPIRIMWLNAEQCGFFGFSIVDPDGQTVVSSDASVVDHTLVNSCSVLTNEPGLI